MVHLHDLVQTQTELLLQWVCSALLLQHGLRIYIPLIALQKQSHLHPVVTNYTVVREPYLMINILWCTLNLAFI